MAQFRFEVSKDFERKLNQLDRLYDDACEDMLKTGGAILRDRLKAASSTFAKYVKLKRPKKNQYGWFTYASFEGKTSSGTPANTAAFVYEYGRGGRAPQPARPFIRRTVKGCEGEVVKAMDDVLEARLKT